MSFTCPSCGGYFLYKWVKNIINNEKLNKGLRIVPIVKKKTGSLINILPLK
jgi:hypothetical protein